MIARAMPLNTDSITFRNSRQVREARLFAQTVTLIAVFYDGIVGLRPEAHRQARI